MSENQDPGSTSESIVAALVGEGKRYANIEELAKARIEADNFIDTLKGENASLRQATQEQTTIKDVMAALKASQDSTGESVTPLSEEDLQKRIGTMLEQRDIERTRSTNRAEAMKLVSDKLNGDAKAIEEFIETKAKALGLSKDSLLSLSDESPVGFANLVGLAPTRPVTGTPNSLPHQNTNAGLSGSVLEIDGYKTKAYFDAKRKEMGNKAFINDRSMQLAQLKAREMLGDRYNS